MEIAADRPASASAREMSDNVLMERMLVDWHPSARGNKRIDGALRKRDCPLYGDA